jgi:hypothetical protein
MKASPAYVLAAFLYSLAALGQGGGTPATAAYDSHAIDSVTRMSLRDVRRYSSGETRR